MSKLIIQEEITVRKGPPYFVGSIFVVLFFILNDTGKLHETDSLLVAAGFLLFIFIYYLLSRNKLILDKECITHHLFFGKQKVIKWKELQSTSLVWDNHGYGTNLSMDFVNYSGKKMSLQTSFYSRKSLKIIAEALIDAASHVTIDKRIVNIAKGEFPWYIF